MSELKPLNPGGAKDHGSTGNSAPSSSSADDAVHKLQRLSRFGCDTESKGVRPSVGIRQSLDAFTEFLNQGPTMAATGAVGRKSGAGGTGGGSRSFMQLGDGSISMMTPIEMGRDELYKSIPFLAVPGLQRKEKNLSIAFSSFAAALDVQETDEYLLSTTGKGLGDKEKEQRMSRMSMMMLEELEGEGGTSVTVPLVFAVLIASFLTFNVGYNISVMNPSEAYAFPGHSTSMWSIAVAVMCLTGPIGAVVGGKQADEKGRKAALLYAAWLFVAGGVLQTLAPNMMIVILARAVVGVATGMTLVAVPVYLGELAPPTLRGTIGTLTQFAMVVGILAADFAGFPFGNHKQWRIMYFIIVVLGACPLLLRSYLLESPRWLLEKNPASAHARFVIKKLRGFRHDEEVETEVDHYLGASKTQSLEGDEDDDSPTNKEPRNATAELYADKSVRLLLVTSLVCQAAQQLCGINAVFYYSSLFFDGVIDNPLVATTLMGAVNVVATYIALLLMDRCGRRTLLMWSSAGMFFSCVLIVLSLLGYFDTTMAIGAVALYVTFFELGLGPIPSLIAAEMFDGKYVTAAMMEGAKLNCICNFLIGLLFPYMNKALGPYSFGPFAIVLILTFVYAWIWMPETAGTTPAELQAELIQRNAEVTYHNMDIGNMSSTFHHPKGDTWDDALAALAEEEEIA